MSCCHLEGVSLLTDPEEIAIISRARQAGVRDPRRSRAHFESIFRDYFSELYMGGHRVLDIGPGQFDFGVMAKAKGADVVGIDRDPAVLELGRHKGFDVIEADLRNVHSCALRGPYDGLFCKYSLNAFWFAEDLASLSRHLRVFLDVLATGGWGWIAPWNGPPKRAELSTVQQENVLAAQADAFRTAGFDEEHLSSDQAKRYGVHGAPASRVLFTRGLGSLTGKRGAARDEAPQGAVADMGCGVVADL